MEKAREFRKTFSCFIDYKKTFACVDHNKLWKILRDENTRPPYLPPEKPVYRARSKLELGMEQQTGSKLGKEYKVVCCHSYLISIQSQFSSVQSLSRVRLFATP